MFESASTMDACGRIKGIHFYLGLGDLKTKRDLDKGLDFFQGNGRTRAQEAVIADLHETDGQYMLKESPHELHDIQSHGSPPVAVRLFIPEEDLVVLDFDNAAV